MIVKLYNAVTKFFRRPNYKRLNLKINVFNINSPQLESKFKKIKLQPGQCVFFWHKKINYVDHIAIVPKQDKEKLNLLEAKLVQAIPPKNHDERDFSGVRACKAIDYMGNIGQTYSRIIIGTPPEASKKQLRQAGKIAREIGIKQKLDNKVLLYSLPIFDKFIYAKWFDFDTHLKFKIGVPYLIAKKETGQFTQWLSTYCGDLIGRIYHQAGIKHLPQIKFLGQFYFRSSTFYEWMRDHHSLQQIVMWEDKNPDKY
jgi:hypothetical protein